ncbi:nifU-like protein [bacterium BMS3Abin05]|nr:nifU-like protein [bacterium BMS3Abin05]GBE27363.1 nifU-like protein [bacterium BMS3Bbin03]HDZ10730.1 SUF system NifU family Fe-S cluster assembly protein [Bacteroidota bacterium]
MALEELYQEIILDHYRHPRNKGKIEDPDIHEHATNPLCGDEIDISAKVENGVIKEVKFSGQGCSISQSSASLLTEALKGKTLEEAETFIAAFREMLAGHELPEDTGIDFGELEALRGVTKFPARLKCATLAWNTAQEAIKAFEKTHSNH